MAIIKCKECGGQVATSAKACPHCGAEIRKKTGVLTWIAVALIALMSFQVILGAIFGDETPSEPKAKPERRSGSVSMVSVAQRFVANRLKAPDSAEFRNVRDAKSSAVCGEVNAKNSFGGYSGYQRFVFGGNGMVVLEKDISLEEFDKIWLELCL